MLKITHLTSVHPRFDTRIFIKQCRSLARVDYNVSLVVADGKGDEQKEGVAVFDVGKSQGRIHRMLKTTGRIYEKGRELDADLYHLHDPELFPVGLKLKRLGKKVIFDSHEDVPRQMISKPYLNPPLRKMIAGVYSCYEQWACKKLDCIVTATPFINEKFSRIGARAVNINNYPVLEELASDKTSWSMKQKAMCYVGGVGRIRGVFEMVEAIGRTPYTLLLAGNIEPGARAMLEKMAGWDQVKPLGFVDRQGVREVMEQAMAGLVLLHPIINYIDALPVKMFEYMSAGIPVIASHFPLWRDIIEGNSCGICVDPLDPRQISSAITTLLDDHKLASTMGKNGRKAVEEIYNWQNEERKLIDLYQEIL